MYYLVDSELNVKAKSRNYDALQEKADAEFGGLFVISESDYKACKG